MQYILTREELDKYVSKDEYDDLQAVIDQQNVAREHMWDAVDKLPEDVRMEFIKNAHAESEYSAREIGKVMNPIVRAEMKAYIDKSMKVRNWMRSEGYIVLSAPFVSGEVTE